MKEAGELFSVASSCIVSITHSIDSKKNGQHRADAVDDPIDAVLLKNASKLLTQIVTSATQVLIGTGF